MLLGDVVELRQGPVSDALADASRVLASVGQALGAGREVVIVPGNHDHHLLDPWRTRRAAEGLPEPLGLETEVGFEQAEPLGRLAAALAAGGASVRAAYPGVWLRDDVYATHGHYVDRHTTVPMFERLGAGAMARLLGRPLEQIRTPDDYEAVLAPIYAWIHAVAQTRGEGGAEYGRSSHGASAQLWRAIGQNARRGRIRRGATLGGLGLGVTALNRAGIGPLDRRLSVTELRRAGLRAFACVLETLRIDAAYAIFGHTHRAGPLPADDSSEWTARGGTRIINSGCWVHEPAFLGRNPSESPYRPGFAVQVPAQGAPELVNLVTRGYV